ncbi:NAD(P)/FAD-dependent oxidoreductase [Rhodoligotrophos defluvii]|uniref:NAD(P)/FAD-dependent oxidoreductase n=1 Tax=Rhodoligotrophos defluvii TaxID=2561934 RepID=UPI0010C9A046|nr:FAD-dependent oxidoreductase [Rhodoligotrophos defluvii]
MTGTSVVVIGGGQAGYQVCAQLRSEGFEGEIHLVAGEPAIPYQRPPLSKAYLLGKTSAADLVFRREEFYSANRIDLHLGVTAEAIDRSARTVLLSDGGRLPYDWVVLATGARNRALPVPGADLGNILYLRTIQDTDYLKERLHEARSVVVVGGGFIGLEFAAVASMLGKEVAVVEMMPRLMARAVPPAISTFFEELHRSHGVSLLLGDGVRAITGENGMAKRVETSSGRSLAGDLVVVGAGVLPNDDLARAADLAVRDGVLVDITLRTSDPSIFAVGDCARFPLPGGGDPIRLESVQNATDQGRHVARVIAGRDGEYEAVPWFWSDQYDIKLQIAGLSQGADRAVSRGDVAARRFSVFSFKAGRLIAVDSINSPGDHMAARKLLGAGLSITPEQAGDPAFDLRATAKAVSA